MYVILSQRKKKSTYNLKINKTLAKKRNRNDFFRL